MKPYAVEVSFTMVVMAEDESDAYQCAREFDSEAWGDTSAKDHTVIGPVRLEDDLKRHGWDGMCIPYGGDGNTRLSDILSTLEPEPVRDEKTLDMFEANQ